MSTASLPTPLSPAVPTRSLDAYERWLQARANDRALNPYELLGLTCFESNQEKIRSIIVRQQQAVEGYRAHAAPELWASFRREFDEAAAVLAQSESRTLLDAALRRQRGGLESREGDANAEGNSAPLAPHAANAMVSCAKCHQANSSQRKFCSACGASLWDTCPKCRAARLASERFCGNCGLDVPEHFATQVGHIEEQLALARRLQAEAQFVDARRILRELARIDDPRFDVQARLATQLLDEFATGQRQQETSAQQAVELARQLVKEHAYESAIKALQDTPAPLRTAEHKLVLDEATERLREAEQLIETIRLGLEQKQTIQLLPLIERFLTLKPQHPQASRLAGQIAEQVLAKANKLSDAEDWDGALELLQAVPEFAVTDAMRKIVENCRERSWLLREVRHSSVLHPSLAGLAERLIELCPGREDFVAQARLLKERQAVSPRNAWQGVADWAAVPQRSPLGVPVQWWGGFQRMVLADGVKLPTSRPALGRLCVAAGLALQALGKAALDLNLTEGPKSSVLGRLATGLRRRAPVVAWGIDLSGTSLKAIRLRWDETAQRPVIEASELLEAESLADAAQPPTGDSWSTQALRQFLSRHDLSGAKVAVNLAAQQCLARFCKVPPAKGKQFAELVRYEARQQFPLALDDLAWEFVDLRPEGRRDDASETNSARVMLLAAKKTAVAGRIGQFEPLGVTPDIVQCDAIALHNFLRFDMQFTSDGEQGAPRDKAIAVLDVGGESSSFLVSGRDFAWFRTFALAGDDFTKALVREFKLVRRQAEQAKRAPHRVRKITGLIAAWEPIFNQLRHECQRSLDQWKTLDPSAPPDELFCIGGGTQIYRLVDSLRGG